jgi:hypothetical protein
MMESEPEWNVKSKRNLISILINAKHNENELFKLDISERK